MMLYRSQIDGAWTDKLLHCGEYFVEIKRCNTRIRIFFAK